MKSVKSCCESCKHCGLLLQAGAQQAEDSSHPLLSYIDVYFAPLQEQYIYPLCFLIQSKSYNEKPWDYLFPLGSEVREGLTGDHGVVAL